MKQAIPMTVASGKNVDLACPQVSDIDIEDIITALRNTRRFAGASPMSVLAHTGRGILDANSTRDKELFALHDVRETYIGDVVTPLMDAMDALYEESKGRMGTSVEPSYWLAEVGNKVDKVIYTAFNITPPTTLERGDIRRRDRAMFEAELAMIKAGKDSVVYPHDIGRWEQDAENFLRAMWLEAADYRKRTIGRVGPEDLPHWERPCADVRSDYNRTDIYNDPSIHKDLAVKLVQGIMQSGLTDIDKVTGHVCYCKTTYIIPESDLHNGIRVNSGAYADGSHWFIVKPEVRKD